MERLLGPINPCLFGEDHLDVECLEQEITNTKFGFSSYGQFESPNHNFQDMKMPFLEMLQSGESPAFSPFCELSFQALLSLQQLKMPPWDESYPPELREGSGRFQEQPESCLTHGVLEIKISPVKSETTDHSQQQQQTRSTIYAADGASSDCNHPEQSKTVELKEPPAVGVNGKKRKREKRTRPSAKNKEEVESQRMTHIAVERNRRRQMNDHLTALRSLMPSSYIQRGDQASIIGGAIDYVKELEQLLQSLQVQKRMRKSEVFDQLGGGRGGDSRDTTSSATSSSTATTGMLAAASLPATSLCRSIKSDLGKLGNCTTEGTNNGRSYEFTAEKKSGAVEVQVTVIQNHVNLKVECPRRAGQLLSAIAALEDLGLTVLHLNITSLEYSVHYSLNLKIEEGCEIGSADGIAVVVHQIFSFINSTT